MPDTSHQKPEKSTEIASNHSELTTRETSALAALELWDGMAKGAYTHNTRRAQRADGAIFQAFCIRTGASFFPADPMTIRRFIEDCVVGTQS